MLKFLYSYSNKKNVVQRDRYIDQRNRVENLGKYGPYKSNRFSKINGQLFLEYKNVEQLVQHLLCN